MPVIGRAGNHLLTEALCEDPFGTLYRGVALRDGRFHRHLLVRVFSEELRRAGLGAKLHSAQAGLSKLGSLKAYERYQVEGEPPFASSPYIAGRSLAATLGRVKEGATAMPLDSGLALIWSLSQEAAKMRNQGFHSGLLNPHSVWIGFDGQLHVLDAPLAGLFHELLPRAPGLQAALRPYEPPPWLDEPRRDLWQLGALAFELLTRHALPMADDARQLARREAVEQAADGQGNEPLPDELKGMLHRMLGTEGGFASIQEFDESMERALFDGEHVPTTFGLAFYMHDLFLREANADTAALKAEKEEDFFAHTDAAKQLKGRIQDNLAVLADAPLAKPRRKRTGAVLAAAAVLLVATGGFFALRGRRDAQRDAQIDALKAQVMVSERRSAELNIQQSDLEQKNKDEAARRARMEAQLAEVRSAQTQAELQRQIEETRKRQAALDRQQADLAAEQRRLAEARQSYEHKAAPAVAATVPALPPPVASAPAAPLEASPRLLAPVTGGLPAGFRGDGSPVKVRVFISEQGRPQKAMVLGGDPALAEIAKAAALAGTYAPAIHGGAPSRDWVTVSVPFVR
jgi:hypothetical protein